MDDRARKVALRIVRTLVPGEYDRLMRIGVNTSEFGYDPFGLERESALLAYALLRLVYDHWFRVESLGVENVPEEGPVLIVPNHSGGIPIDGVMIAVDLAKNMRTPRIMRAVVDNFAGFLPFVNLFFYRCGQIIGARRNLIDLLKQGDVITVFPEGHKGTGKPFSERYRPRPFNVGFIELSIMHRTPVVPAAVIGAEEQYPYLLNLKPLARFLNFPYLPVPPLALLLGPLGLLPLPTKYRILYGEPIHFYRDYSIREVRDPDIIRGLADQVQKRVSALIEQGLAQRKDVFEFALGPIASAVPARATKAVRSARALLDRRARPARPSREPAPVEDGGSQDVPSEVETGNGDLDRYRSYLEDMDRRTRDLELAIVRLQQEVHEGGETGEPLHPLH